MSNEHTPLKIIAVGDMMLGDQHFCSGFGVASQIEEKGDTYLFEDVAPLLKKGDDASLMSEWICTLFGKFVHFKVAGGWE